MCSEMPRTTVLTWDTSRVYFFFSSRRRHTRFKCDWSSDVCSSDLEFTFVPGKFTRARANGPLNGGCLQHRTAVRHINRHTPTDDRPPPPPPPYQNQQNSYRRSSSTSPRRQPYHQRGRVALALVICAGAAARHDRR